MNEQRIRELEDQCWVKVPCDFDMYAGGSSTIRTVFDRKKFAELIVRECINLVKDCYAEPQSRQSPYQTVCASTIIEDHFGVEDDS